MVKMMSFSNIAVGKVEVVGLPDLNPLAGGNALKDVVEACGCLSTGKVFHNSGAVTALKTYGNGQEGNNLAFPAITVATNSPPLLTSGIKDNNDIGRNI